MYGNSLPTLPGFPVGGGQLNAANVTHALKLIGGNTRMWVGVVVIAIAVALVVNWIIEEHRNRDLPGFTS
jgi:hypothetical protein